MSFSRLTDLILRRETFWVALALFVIGSVVPKTIWIGTSEVEIARVITGLGSLLITTLIFVSMAVILRTAYEAWRYGYAEALAES